MCMIGLPPPVPRLTSASLACSASHAYSRSAESPGTSLVMREVDYNPACSPSEVARLRAQIAADDALLRALELWSRSAILRLPTIPTRKVA